jgi:hypothetical protein
VVPGVLAMAFDKLTPEVEARIWSFKARGYTNAEIAMVLRLPFSVVRQITNGPQWPKVFTRVQEDGSWEIIRRP